MRAPDGSRAPLWTPVPGTVTGANRDALVCWEETAGASAAVATPALATRETAVAAMVRMGVISCSWGLGLPRPRIRPPSPTDLLALGAYELRTSSEMVVGPMSLVAHSRQGHRPSRTSRRKCDGQQVALDPDGRGDARDARGRPGERVGRTRRVAEPDVADLRRPGHRDDERPPDDHDHQHRHRGAVHQQRADARCR